MPRNNSYLFQYPLFFRTFARMIRWAHILMVTVLSGASLLITSCDDGSRQRLQLEELERQNRADSLMTNDSLALGLASWFDRHGTANEQMRAHYILGRTFADLGEAPQAIDAYNDAADRADTTASDCDYYTLCRVYAQMSDILYSQNLLDANLQSLDKSVFYAWKAKDTLTAMRESAFKMIAYTDKKMYDSVACIFNSIHTDYGKYSSKKYIAQFCVIPIEAFLALHRYEDVRRSLFLYETETGFFDSDNVGKGHEVYYYYKGKYYLSVGQLDSAQFFFRKELVDGLDYNNQNAASLGLAELYQQKHQYDSVAKYALYAYAMNDSNYNQQSMRMITQAMAMYEYGRFERQAQKERERANLLNLRFWFMAVVMGSSLIILILVVFFLRSKREYAVKQYLLKTEQLKNANQSLSILREQGKASAKLMSERELDIQRLRTEIDKLLESRQLRVDSEKAMLADSDIGHVVLSKSASGQKITESEWTQIEDYVSQNLPGFSIFLAQNTSSLGLTKTRMCILLRLYAGVKDTGSMLDVSAAYISKISSEVLLDLFQEKGSGKRLSSRLRQIR